MAARLVVLRDVMVELEAALPSDRAVGFGAALGDRLANRVCVMEIDERADDAVVSDLAPVFAALRHVRFVASSGHCRQPGPSNLDAISAAGLRLADVLARAQARCAQAQRGFRRGRVRHRAANLARKLRKTRLCFVLRLWRRS